MQAVDVLVNGRKYYIIYGGENGNVCKGCPQDRVEYTLNGKKFYCRVFPDVSRVKNLNGDFLRCDKCIDSEVK